jgi:hypothetical protein
MNARQKKAGLQMMQASSVGFMPLRQLSTDSNDDDGGGGNSGVRCTSSMTAQNSSCSTDTVGSSRMDSSRIGTLDSQIRPRLLQRQP